MSVPGGYIRLNYSSTHVDLPVLSEEGLRDAEDFSMWPEIQNTYLDGSRDTQFRGYRRKVVVTTQPIALMDDCIKIFLWYLDNARTIDYGTETAIPFTPQNGDGYKSVWVENFAVGRSFVFELAVAAIVTQAT